MHSSNSVAACSAGLQDYSDYRGDIMPMGVGDIDVNAIPGSMRGLMTGNEISKGAIENQIKNIERQYAPVTVPAEAASKLAYANLVGPQFLAKMMGNQDIVASLKQPQRENILRLIYGGGIGQQSGNNMMANNMPKPQNPFLQLLSGLTGGMSDRMFGRQPMQTGPMQTPQMTQTQSVQNGSGVVMPPATNAPVPLPLRPESEATNPDYFETAGKAAGIKEEGRESGTLRAKAINELDQQYEQAEKAEQPVDHLIDISQNPVFMNMRNKVPFFQDKQLKMLAKTGTPEEQKLIGDFITSTMNAVANTVNSFAGGALAKEFDIGEKMKISPDDTWNVMTGKLESVGTFAQILKEKSRIASEIMQNQHVSRGRAWQLASKQVDGNRIRADIRERLTPKVTIRNKKTGEVITISASEAREKYGVGS